MESITPNKTHKGCKTNKWNRKKEKTDKILEEIESLGIKDQVEAVRTKGFPDLKVKVIFRALVANENDVDKALEYLKLKEEKRAQRKLKREEKDKSLEELVT